ncbi:MAG: porin [Pseudomonadota bacterium]
MSVSAGFAAADVAISGSARMGVVGAYNSDTKKNATTFSSNVHATFTGSGTTDGGLAFGGSFDMHNATGADAGTSGSTYISGAFGKISMGGVDSGDKAAVGQLSSVGYEGVGSKNSISYAADGGKTDTGNDTDILGTSGAKVLYTYSAGAMTISASSAQLSNGAANHTAYGIGATYTAGAVKLAIGYGSNEISGIKSIAADLDTYTLPVHHLFDGGTGSITDVTAAVTYTMGDTTLKAIYQDKSADITVGSEDFSLASVVSMGLSVDHKLDALTLTAYALTTNVTSDYSHVDVTLSHVGIGASYNLGGGASFKAGWAQSDVALPNNKTASRSGFDAGVNFSF